MRLGSGCRLCRGQEHRHLARNGKTLHATTNAKPGNLSCAGVPSICTISNRSFSSRTQRPFFFPDCSRPAPQDCQGASPPALCVGLWAVAQDRLNTYATSSRSGVDIRLALRQKVADVFVHGDAHLVKMSSNMVALAGPTLTRPRQVMKRMKYDLGAWPRLLQWVGSAQTLSLGVT